MGWLSDLLGGATSGLIPQEILDVYETQLPQIASPDISFKPFGVTTSGLGKVSTTAEGDTTFNLSPEQEALQTQLFGQAGTMFGQVPTAGASLGTAGQNLLNIGQEAYGQTPGSALYNYGAGQLGQTPGDQAMAMGQQALGQTPYGLGATQAAAGQAYGMGSQFMQNAMYQPADINALRGQFAGQVGGLLAQQPSAAIGQLGSQALALGSQGLATQAPSDVEALRQQYTQLASQTASRALQDTTGRETDVYNRIRATQRPEEERQRMALEERLAAQGRLGVRTNMYGGTPEQLALSKAQEEAQNAASLAAIQQAQSERQQAVSEAQTFGGLFGQQAGLSSQLQNQAQARAAQLSQLGLSANQIESQLRSEGLSQASTAASQAAQLAQLAGGLQAQQAGLGAQYAGLGSSLTGQSQALGSAQQAQALQALQAGQGMNLAQQQAAMQALQGGQGMNLAQQQQALAAMQGGQGMLQGQLGLQQGLQGMGLAAMQAGYAPQANLLNALQGGLNVASMADVARRQQGEFDIESAIANMQGALGQQQGLANLYGGVYSSLLGGLGGLVQGAASGAGGMLEDYIRNKLGL